MEEPKKVNNPPANQSMAAAAPKNISTATGALIVLAAAVIAGIAMFYFFRTDSSENFYGNNSIMPGGSLKSKTETADTKEDETASQAQVEEEAAQPADEAALDFGYELKKLDDQNNSVSSDDFDENEMSDANIEL